MPDHPKSVTLSVNGISDGTIVVNGMDLTQYVRGVEIHTEIGQLPQVVLHVVSRDGLDVALEEADVTRHTLGLLERTMRAIKKLWYELRRDLRRKRIQQRRP